MFSGPDERKIILERSQPSEEPEYLTLEQIVSTTFDGVTGRQAGTGSESHICEEPEGKKEEQSQHRDVSEAAKDKSTRQTLMHHDVWGMKCSFLAREQQEEQTANAIRKLLH